ncbi:MAG: hypothetical protein KJN76_02470 [Eudoraea sp.]|nr:hypothetical protein [Eudoraea sp.]
MNKEIKAWKKSIWGNKRKKMNRHETQTSITEDNLFIGASFGYDVLNHKWKQGNKKNDKH